MFEEFSTVRVVKLCRPMADYDGWSINQRPPQVGDVGCIIDILRAPNLPIHYVVELSGADGIDIWLSEFEASELELVSEEKT